MNPQPQGQLGQPGQASQGVQMRLLKPEQLRSLPVLTPEEINKYEEGLRSLWETVKNNPPDSQAHISAKGKIVEFSRMVYKKITSLQMRQQQQQQQQQGAARPQPGGAQAGQSGQQAQSPHNTAQNSAPIGQNRPQGPATGTAPSSLPGAAPSLPSGNVQKPQQTQIPKAIMDHINQLPWNNLQIPQNLGQEQAAKYVSTFKQKYMQSLMTMEQARTRIHRVEKHVKEREEKGQPFPPEDLRRILEQKEHDTRLHADANKVINNIRTQLGQGANAGRNGQGPSNAQPPRSQPGSVPPQNAAAAAASTNSMQAMTASVNAAMDAAKNQQIAAANRAQGAAAQQLPQAPATPATPSTTAAQQQPHPATAPQPQVKIEPGTQQQQQQQHPPPVNTAPAAASTAHMPSAGTPTTASARVQTPQSATQPQPQPQQQPVPGGPVRPLTHAAAVNRANSSTNIGVQPGPSHSGITPTSGSAGLMGSNPQPSHPHAHPQPGNPTVNPKMPIPKTLPQQATANPVPVSTGGGVANGRPTMGGGTGIAGGVQGQAVIQKNTNTYNFDADGEHVLSKKKLDELTRQVVGGQPGIDGNYMTPDVEEAALNAADAFVDSVTSTACKLAVARGSKVLEIRDIQMALERGYNIRIPGYTSDELRTVRKVQPHANWISKMSAIQAAKVTSAGKDDKRRASSGASARKRPAFAAVDGHRPAVASGSGPGPSFASGASRVPGLGAGTTTFGAPYGPVATLGNRSAVSAGASDPHKRPSGSGRLLSDE
ncbi:hypothetical protein DL762_006117 [Monosporascus cannonballus]|uniref:Transcription initiation factor TFIID subunit 12 domain-containing protein n=1 Tax=Monosporascus cannonballus TaxID=155416 RepID=A0ABY0H7A3_9PEZI|nr:hypothetical protein DL762_006117 [Monosporascus cannonballus]